MRWRTPRRSIVVRADEPILVEPREHSPAMNRQRQNVTRCWGGAPRYPGVVRGGDVERRGRHDVIPRHRQCAHAPGVVEVNSLPTATKIRGTEESVTLGSNKQRSTVD